ncbi:MAG: histidine--tRNA ligase [Phycisphaerales bacterium]|nr:MAG: histidine--tRNA ligase [Phycisphaerales bacterium]
MKFKAIKGARDFYPPDMEVRNAIFDAWREVSLRNGFVEYDGPTLEYLDLYTAKSGDEIVQQLFHLTDRGGRELALRPEMTPTLARMVNAQVATLPKPIKWFCIPRCYRAERPQRGRLREFFQWNIDIVGLDDPLADAETIFVAVDLFRWFGLSPRQVVMKINSRELVAHMLLDLGVDATRLPPLYAVLDKRDKMPRAAFDAALAEILPDESVRRAMNEHLALPTLADVRSARTWAPATHDAIVEVQKVLDWLDRWGVGEYCTFDLGVVRGLAYYTGIVFEAYSKGGLKRSVCGGGRYDELLRVLGGPEIPAVGFASSDVVMQDLLDEFNLLPGRGGQRLDAYVIDADPSLFEQLISIVGALREKGVRADFSYRRLPLGKQLKAASNAGCAAAILLGQETRDRDVVTIKDLATGQQREVPRERLLAEPVSNLPRGGPA